MKKEANPYVSYSLEEVQKAEAKKFVIVMNGTFFAYEGSYTFTEEVAETLFNTLLNGFRDILEQGEPAQVKETMDILREMKIYPLRLH